MAFNPVISTRKGLCHVQNAMPGPLYQSALNRGGVSSGTPDSQISTPGAYSYLRILPKTSYNTTSGKQSSIRDFTPFSHLIDTSSNTYSEVHISLYSVQTEYCSIGCLCYRRTMSLDESVESNYTIMNLPPLSQTAKGCPKRPTNNGITELCDRIRLACKTVVANETLVVATRTFSKRFTYENGQTSPDFIHETRPEEYENLELMSKRFIIGNGRSFWPQDRFKDKSL